MIDFLISAVVIAAVVGLGWLLSRFGGLKR